MVLVGAHETSLDVKSVSYKARRMGEGYMIISQPGELSSRARGRV